MKSFLKFIFIFIAGSLLPAFVFAADQSKDDIEFLSKLEEQLIFRKSVEANSFATTQQLCDAFVLRQKFNMGRYPDPASETYKAFVEMNSEERYRYYSSLYAWIGIGNKAMLVNWGFDDNPIPTAQNMLLLNHSRFLQTLVVTRGFFEAAQNCGELNPASLKKLLFEQELAQTTLSFVIAPVAVLRGVTVLGRASWPLIRSTMLGTQISRVPWSRVAKVALGASAVLIAYGAWGDYQLVQEQNHNPDREKQNLDRMTELNVRNSLIRWYKNKKEKNATYIEAEKYLLDRQDYLKDLFRRYEAELNKIGESKIQAITEKYVKIKSQTATNENEMMSDEELEIFMKAVTLANLKIFIQIYF